MAIKREKDGSVEVTLKGCVVSVSTREERVMSDVYAPVTYAVVFDAATETFKEVYVRAHFECDPGTSSTEVDASNDIQSIYALHQEIKAAEAALADMKRGLARQVAAVKAPAMGRTVKVVKGRKVPVGTTGECFYLRDGNYGPRVGLKDSAGQVHWTAASNCEAVVG